MDLTLPYKYYERAHIFSPVAPVIGRINLCAALNGTALILKRLCLLP